MSKKRYDDYDTFDEGYEDLQLNVSLSEKHSDSPNKGKKKNKHNGNNENNNRPLCKYLKPNVVYDRDDILNTLVKKNGLIDMIKDLKSYKINHDKKPNYVQPLLRDIIFASALPEAISIVCKKDILDNNGIGKKDFDYLMDEILIFLNNIKDPRIQERYNSDKESISCMTKAYTNILYKFNKKKVKKFEEIKNLSESIIKQLVVLTSGGNVRTSIYSLLKFIYRSIDNDELKLTNKSFSKILKTCYGKSNMDEVVKYIMLEKTNPNWRDNQSTAVSNAWIMIDEFIRNYLESLDKKSIEKIIKSYITERKHQEKDKKIKRRFGDRRTIHPDDYPKLTKVFESIEEKDFSLIQYLR